MTLARQATKATKIPMDWPMSWDPDGNEVPIRYPVVLMVERVSQFVPRHTYWEHKIGNIVTHLSIEDYCQLHGYKLVEVYPSRQALTHERTELY